MDDNKNARIRVEQLPMGGWKAEVLDHGQNPPAVKTRRFVTTAQVAELFTKTASLNSGVLEKPSKLCAMAIGAGSGAYMYLEPGHVRPIMLYTGRELNEADKKPVLAWVPPAAWIVKAPSGNTDKWEAYVALVAPDREGNIFSPNSRVGQYPMSNTYENYSICWGNVRKPIIKMPNQIHEVSDLFFRSVFNGHVWCLRNVDFFAHVRSFATADVVKKMTDAERWDKLQPLLPNGFLRGTLSQYWETMTRTITPQGDN